MQISGRRYICSGALSYSLIWFLFQWRTTGVLLSAFFGMPLILWDLTIVIGGHHDWSSLLSWLNSEYSRRLTSGHDFEFPEILHWEEKPGPGNGLSFGTEYRRREEGEQEPVPVTLLPYCRQDLTSHVRLLLQCFPHPDTLCPPNHWVQINPSLSTLLLAGVFVTTSRKVLNTDALFFF